MKKIVALGLAAVAAFWAISRGRKPAENPWAEASDGV